MKSFETNYFVCTLGQAAELNTPEAKSQSTINDFFDEQCRKTPSLPAAGFPIPSKDKDNWSHYIFTFKQLQRLSIALAKHEYRSLFKAGECVALLCQSSVDFLLTWLSLMRNGQSVLLIAPQCQPSAVAHLCKESNVDYLIYEESYHEVALETKKIRSSINLKVIQNSQHLVQNQLEAGGAASTDFYTPQPLIHENDIAYLHHTSGTSSGLPKPIPQSHRGAAGVLPRLNGEAEATFTTTPLYHGGIADCFRAWTSGAMVWLFPGKELPITSHNILNCLDVAANAVQSLKTPPVRYFSSVPYVLQMVAADDRGLAKLKGMDIVGVGGAALPPSVGDDLVSEGINLVSRFGSAECGFLMSSHRHYEMDKEWQYLRSYGSSLLSFEPQDDGLAELVIQPQWPHMAKWNREDGSYATADLFRAHPSIPNAWKYHSRADSQLTLITGKKFDPAPLEDSIAACPDIRDCLVFGNGRQFPGALLFRKPDSTGSADDEFLAQIWPWIEKLNNEGQSHTRIPKSMLVVIAADAESLEKSSKGTILRRQAEERFKSVIEKAYQNESANSVEAGRDRVDIPDHEVTTVVLDTIKHITRFKHTIPADADLFAHGVDSVACMQIRALLQIKLLPLGASPLPLNVVYDCGSIEGIANYIDNVRNGKTMEQEDEIQLMHDLVQKYSSFDKISYPMADSGSNADQNPFRNDHTSSEVNQVTVLTGATGALGAHILHQLRSHPFTNIVCLVRASSSFAAHERVHKSLEQRLRPGLPDFLETHASTAWPIGDSTEARITCLQTNLSSPNLGLSEEMYQFLAKKTTLVIHAAWTVNFTTRLRSFEKDHIAGLRNLLAFVLSSPQGKPTPRFIFCSSTAAVTSSQPSPIEERISKNPLEASPLGYSRSKWVAEQICDAAGKHERMRARVGVCRIGQLCGDTEHGVWNKSEAWPLMLSAAKVTNGLPKLENEKLSWLAVDEAARAVIEVADCLGQNEMSAGDEVSVYHILNPDRTRTWDHLLSWVQKLEPSLETLSPKEWLERLESLEEPAAKHPARKLIGLWKEAYGGNTESQENTVDDEKQEKAVGGRNVVESSESGGKNGLAFDTEKAKSVSKAMSDVQPISKEAFGKMWRWIGENVGIEDRSKDG